MARTDAIVLGAGMVGVSAALHLAKRGLAVAIVDRGGPGEETSYGNAGIIEGNTYFPYPFPNTVSALLKIALQAGAGGELPSVLSAETGAVAVCLSAPFDRRSDARLRADDAAAVCGVDYRA